jgi:plasmid stabilization system protein ParE
MYFELFYLDEVKQDIKDAKQWYRKRQPGLEKTLASDIKYCLEHIRKNPFHYPLKYKNVRVVYCPVFPYAVHFYVEEPKEKIIIIAVIHQRRNPELVIKRSEK